MTTYELLTIFPTMIDSYFAESIMKRAIEAGRISVRAHDLRQWAEGRHQKVDDKPYGGGPGMVMSVVPFYNALKALKVGTKEARAAAEKKRRASKRAAKKPVGTRVVLLSAKGARFTHAHAVRLAQYKRVVFLCGRYEGVDERVAERLADEELSLGDFVLTGGELAAMTMIDAIARHIPGVLGKQASLDRESHAVEGVTEHPQYTRPEVFAPARGKKWSVPAAMLSGNHAEIEKWRKNQSGTTTKAEKR